MSLESIYRIFKKRENAIIKGDDGITLATVAMEPKKDTFEYQGRTYNIVRMPECRDLIKGIWYNNYYYHYNIFNPMPLAFQSGKWVPLMDSELYYRMLQNKVLKDLNTVNKNWFANITFGKVVIGLVVLALLGYAINYAVNKGVM